ncbi:MAG: hypothetical protein ACN4GG_09275 [Akkermansiaceae bacterium]
MAKTIQVTTPAENIQRKVMLFKKIDEHKMAAGYGKPVTKAS